MKKTIMVVDDEQPITKVVEDILQPEGYKVVSAMSGQDALDKLKKVKPNLILIDFFMPRMSGRELCEKIRADKKLKDLRIVFVTVARFSKTGIQTLRNLDVLDYIQKPFDNKELLKIIKKIIG